MASAFLPGDEVVGDFGQLRLVVAVARPGRLAVDEQLERVVGREQQPRLANRAAGGNRQREPRKNRVALGAVFCALSPASGNQTHEQPVQA